MDHVIGVRSLPPTKFPLEQRLTSTVSFDNPAFVALRVAGFAYSGAP